MSAEGTTLWAVRGGGTSYDYLNGVAVDAAGNIIGSADLSSSLGTFGDTVIASARVRDAVMWKVR